MKKLSELKIQGLFDYFYIFILLLSILIIKILVLTGEFRKVKIIEQVKHAEIKLNKL